MTKSKNADLIKQISRGVPIAVLCRECGTMNYPALNCGECGSVLPPHNNPNPHSARNKGKTK